MPTAKSGLARASSASATTKKIRAGLLTAKGIDGAPRERVGELPAEAAERFALGEPS
jgi:hypothetical protein